MIYYKFIRLESIYYFCEIDYIFKTEQWKDIPAYEGLYKVSDLGRVKSLTRKKINGINSYISKPFILRQGLSAGRCNTAIFKNKKSKSFGTHQLVAMAFLNHKPCGYELVVDHINNNPIDNKLINLQVITQRENVRKEKKGFTSKYIGVSWDKKNKKWRALITIKGKNISLGRRNTELEAYDLYLEAFKKVKYEK